MNFIRKFLKWMGFRLRPKKESINVSATSRRSEPATKATVTLRMCINGADKEKTRTECQFRTCQALVLLSGVPTVENISAGKISYSSAVGISASCFLHFTVNTYNAREVINQVLSYGSVQIEKISLRAPTERMQKARAFALQNAMQMAKEKAECKARDKYKPMVELKVLEVDERFKEPEFKRDSSLQVVMKKTTDDKEVYMLVNRLRVQPHEVTVCVSAKYEFTVSS